MSIAKLPVFSEDGEKNTTGLVLTDGFPRGQKPARQWFNWLFNSLAQKINELIDRAEPIKVGDVYLTTINHVDGTAVSLHHGYGTWGVYSAGRAIVGAGSYTDSNGVSRTITGGQVFGQYQKTLTTENIAPHAHVQMASSDQTVGEPGKKTPTTDTGSTGSTKTVGVTTDDFFTTTFDPLQTGETGGVGGEAQPFDISPPSTGTYMWVRLT